MSSKSDALKRRHTPLSLLTLEDRCTPAASIGGMIFEDQNGDGVQQTGEPGIASATVDLVNKFGTVVAQQQTGVDGSYLFNSVPAGSYAVRRADLSGYTPTSPSSDLNGYHFTRLVTQGNGSIDDSNYQPTTISFSGVAINNRGHAVFPGLYRKNAANVPALFLFDGQTVTRIADVSTTNPDPYNTSPLGPFTGFMNYPTIDDQDRVTFEAYVQTGPTTQNCAVFQWDNGSFTVVDPGNTQNTSQPEASSTGTVVFNDRDFLFVWDGSLHQVYYKDQIPSPGGDTGFGNPVVNDSGAIAFTGAVFRGFTGGTVTIGLYLANTAGSPIQRIATEYDPAPGGGRFLQFGQAQINDRGDVIFVAQVDNTGDDLTDYLGIFEYSGGTFTRVMDTTGSYMQNGGYSPQILNDGTSIFWSPLDDQLTGDGVYTGPDPLTDAIISAGDKLLGKAINNIAYSYQHAANNFDQFTFVTGYTDNSLTALYLGMPADRQVVTVADGGSATDVDFGFDKPPTLVSFTRQSPTDNPTDATTLVFRATFSEPVSVVNAADFAVDGTTTAQVTSVSIISPNTYDVTVSGGDLAQMTGTIGINLASSQNVVDSNGNPLPTTEPPIDETYTRMLFSPARVTLKLTDSDGDQYSVLLTGPGQVAVLQNNPNGDGKGPIDQIYLKNTDPKKSDLRIRVVKRGSGAVPGNFLSSIGSIVSQSGIRSINARQFDLVGAGIDLANAALGKLAIHDVQNGAVITTGGGVGDTTNMTANRIENGSVIHTSGVLNLTAAAVGQGTIGAAAIGRLAVAGDFHADVDATGNLKTAQIHGSLCEATWQIHGELWTLSVAKNVENLNLIVGGTLSRAILGAVDATAITVGQRVKSLRASTFIDSYLFLSYVANDSADPIGGGGAFSGIGTAIDSFVVTGKSAGAFKNSTIAAEQVGRVSLSRVATTNGGKKFGVLAGESVGRVIVDHGPSLPFAVSRLTAPVDLGVDDFRVVVA